MSIEEIISVIEELADGEEKYANDYDYVVGVRNTHAKKAEALLKAISLLRTHQDNETKGDGWVSVDDPPEDGTEALVYTAWHETMTTLKAVYLNGAWWGEPGMRRLPSVPTHWRPLPEPPKEV